MVNVPEIPAAHVSINPEFVAKVAALERLNSTLVAVKTNDDCALANQVNVEAHQLAKGLEARRVEAKEPFLAIGKMIDAAVKPLIERAMTVRNRTDTLLMGYKRELEKRAEEQRAIQEQEKAQREALERQAAREAELAKRKNEAPTKAIETLNKINELATGTATVEIPKMAVHAKKHPVLKILVPSLVPDTVKDATGREYILILFNEAEIKRAIAAGCNVPGCTIVEEEVTSRR